MSDSTSEASLTWQVTPELLCVIRRDGTFQAVNPAWETRLGWTHDDMRGRPYLEYVHEDDVAPSIAAFAAVTDGNPVLEFRNRYRTKAGGHRWLEWVAVPEGDLIVCTARDVTEERENVETIEEQRSEAELREQFLAVLGHDLRNPLAAVISGIDLLSREDGNSRHRKIIEEMRQSSGRMVELVNNMMDFARVRLGSGIGLQLEPVTDIEPTIRKIVEEMTGPHVTADFEITSHSEGEVELDLPRIEQVLSNLLGNALSHGDANRPIRIDSEIRGNSLSLAVCNEGTPIKREARNHLFKPFLRDEIQRSQQGLGLGLYISSEIVKAHGGTLDVVSDQEETCFTVRIGTRADEG